MMSLVWLVRARSDSGHGFDADTKHLTTIKVPCKQSNYLSDCMCLSNYLQVCGFV